MSILVPLDEVAELLCSMVNEKRAAAEAEALKKLEATDKPTVTVTVDKDEPAKAMKQDEPGKAEKKAEVYEAGKPVTQVKVTKEESPANTLSINPTKPAKAAKEMASEVGKDTDKYTTKGSENKADDSSSAIKTERESATKSAELRKSALIKVAMYLARK